VASRSRTVLVTGAGGFTGRHLCAHLREHGFRVVGLTEHAPHNEGDIQADLTDARAVAAAVRATAPDQVVHLAAIAFPGHTHAADVYRVNIGGTLALLEALAEQGMARSGILLPSTATVYAASAEPLSEDAPVRPLTHYAVSKLAMEHMARLFASRLPIVIVRPFNYTGPGQREPYVIAKIVRHFAERAPAIELGNIDVERDFQDVRTVVDAYRRLLDAPQAAGETFNLCSGTVTTVRNIVQRLEAISGHRIEIRINPQFVRPGEPPRTVGSAAKLRASIGELMPVPLDTTLGDMLREQVTGSPPC
jgi:nucleoside-diphosphate-sugar epimerase